MLRTRFLTLAAVAAFFSGIFAPQAHGQTLRQVLDRHLDTFNRKAFPGRLVGRVVSSSTITASSDRRAIAELVTEHAKGVRNGRVDTFSLPNNDEDARRAYARGVVEPFLEHGSLVARVAWQWTNGPSSETYAVLRPGASVGDEEKILEFLTMNFVKPLRPPESSSACDNTKYRGVWENIYGSQVIFEYNVLCRGGRCRPKAGDGVQKIGWFGLTPKEVAPPPYCSNNTCWRDAQFVVVAGFPKFSVSGSFKKATLKIDVGAWAFTVIGPITVALDTVGCPECPCDPVTQTPASFRAPKRIASLNTSAHEGSPVLSDDMRTIYFASSRPGGQGSWDIWAAQRESLAQPWSKPFNVRALNSAGLDAPGSLRFDGRELYVSSDRFSRVANIFASQRTSSGWSTPGFVETLSSGFHDLTPRLSEDALEMWFATSRANYGQTIHRSARTSLTAPWSLPARVPSLDGVARESSAQLLANNRDVVYHSNRSGTTDLFVASRPRASLPFGAAKRIAGLDTKAVESDAFVTKDGFSIYFSRGSTGDLYRADRLLPLCRVDANPTLGKALDVRCRRDPGDFAILMGAHKELADPISIPGFGRQTRDRPEQHSVDRRRRDRPQRPAPHVDSDPGQPCAARARTALPIGRRRQEPVVLRLGYGLRPDRGLRADGRRRALTARRGSPRCP